MASMGFTGFYWDLLDYTRCYWVLLSLRAFLVGIYVFDQVLGRFSMASMGLLEFTVVMCLAEFYWVFKWLFHWMSQVLLGLTENRRHRL